MSVNGQDMMIYSFFIFCGGHLGYFHCSWMKKLETTDFPYNMFRGSKKSQVNRFYMKNSLNYTTTYTTPTIGYIDVIFKFK